ncbi:MAG: hypothetical protein ACK4HB_02560 [Candidatus Bipolaricaulia bacterium]
MRRSVLAGLVAVALLAASALAQPRIEVVEVGFNGRFFPGALTPIVISLSHRGTAHVFDLEVSQEVREITERSFIERVKVPVNLGPGTQKNISFDFFMRSVSTPLQIKLFAGDREIARTEIDVRERWSETPLVLGLAVEQFPSLELIEPERLPRRWTSYDGVGQIIWGRLDPARLTAEQRTALLSWLLQGGELVILSGENWYEQFGTGSLPEDEPTTAHGFWSHLLPIMNGRVERRESDGREVLSVAGDLRAGSRIVLSDRGRPVVWERPVGHGKVLLVALSTLPKELELFEIPQSERGAEGDALIIKALGALTVPFPSRELMSFLLIFFIIGFGLSGVLVARLKRLPVWIALAALVLSLVLFGYGHSPAFSSEKYSLDIGVVQGWQGEPFAWEQSWYGVFSRRAREIVLGVSGDSVRVVKPAFSTAGNVWTELTPAGEKYLHFHSQRESVRFFHAQRMRESFVRFSLDAFAGRVRVINQASVPLRDAVVHLGDDFYRLGTITARAEVARSLGELTRMSKSAWLDSLSEMRRMLWHQWGNSSGTPKLIGWLEESSLWAQTESEARITLRLVIVEGG